MVREAKIRGRVETSVDEQELRRSTSRIRSSLESATNVVPALDTNNLRRRLERMVPGGRTASRAVRELRGSSGRGDGERGDGGSGGSAAADATGTGVQAQQLRELKRIRKTMQKEAVTPDDGGGSTMLLGGAGRAGGVAAMGGKVVGGLAMLAGVGIGADRLLKSSRDGGNEQMQDWARENLGDWAAPPEDSGPPKSPLGGERRGLGEGAFDKPIERVSGSPAADAVRSAVDAFSDSRGVERLEAAAADASGAPGRIQDAIEGAGWPELPDLESAGDWPELPDLASVGDWPELPDLSASVGDWPDLPDLSAGMSWPDPPDWVESGIDAATAAAGGDGDAARDAVSGGVAELLVEVTGLDGAAGTAGYDERELEGIIEDYVREQMR